MKGFGSASFDQRQYPRLDFSVPIAFSTASQQVPDGVTGNISLGGIKAYLPQPVEQNQILDVQILLPCQDGKKSFKARAQVVWSQNGRFEGGWNCQAGLKFLEIAPDSLAAWHQFLREWQGGKESRDELK